MTTIHYPKPGTRYPSPIEKSGWWKVPYGCVRVTLAQPTNYPIDHVVDRELAARQRRERSLTRSRRSR